MVGELIQPWTQSAVSGAIHLQEMPCAEAIIAIQELNVF